MNKIKLPVKNTKSQSALKIELNRLQKQSGKIQLEEWINKGCPDPPPHIVKQMTIEEYRKKYGITTLIETGTFLGDMVEAQKKRFNKIISVELGVELFARAQKRFINNSNVIIVQGDSGKVLPEILKDINEPVIFWLDGHYSAGITVKGDKECPIIEELEAILNRGKYSHIILIDDARCFKGEDDFPACEELLKYIKSRNKKYKIEIKYDIIRCVI